MRTVAFTYDHAESPKNAYSDIHDYLTKLYIGSQFGVHLIRAKSSTLIAVGFAPSIGFYLPSLSLEVGRYWPPLSKSNAYYSIPFTDVCYSY